MSSNTQKVKSPIVYAIRQAANAAGNNQGRLGDFFRRLAYRKGRQVAIIATARKIAVIIYKMLETGEEYCYEYTREESERLKRSQIKRIRKTMTHFNVDIKDVVPT